MFAAASMTETMNQLKEMYEQNNPNVTITYNFDSSGKLLDPDQGGRGLRSVHLRRPQADERHGRQPHR